MIYHAWIRTLQHVSILLMWLFAAGVLVFVPWLIVVAARWNDALNWTVAISLVMTPVYLTVAGTLTYVFIGLRRGAPRDGSEGGDRSRE
jgi:hypothetical protein